MKLHFKILGEQLAIAEQNNDNRYLGLASIAKGFVRNSWSFVASFVYSSNSRKDLIDMLKIARAQNLINIIQSESTAEDVHKSALERAERLKSSVEVYLPIFDILSVYAGKRGNTALTEKISEYRDALIYQVFNSDTIPLSPLHELLSDPELQPPLERLEATGSDYLPGFVFSLKSSFFNLTRHDVQHIEQVLGLLSKLELSEFNLLTEGDIYRLLCLVEELKAIEEKDSLVDLMIAAFPQLPESMIRSSVFMLLSFSENLNLDDVQKHTLASNLTKFLHAGIVVRAPDVAGEIVIDWIKHHDDIVRSGDLVAYAKVKLNAEPSNLGKVECGDDLGGFNAHIAGEVVAEEGGYYIKAPIKARQNGKLQLQDLPDTIDGGADIATIISQESFIVDKLPKLLLGVAKISQGPEVGAIKYAFSDMMEQDNTVDRVTKGLSLAYMISKLDDENVEAIKGLVTTYLDSDEIPKLNQLFDFSRKLKDYSQEDIASMNQGIVKLFTLSEQAFGIDSLAKYHDVFSNMPKDTLLLLKNDFFSLPESMSTILNSMNRFATLDSNAVSGVVKVFDTIQNIDYTSLHALQVSTLRVFDAMSEVGYARVEECLQKLFPEEMGNFRYVVEPYVDVAKGDEIAKYTMNGEEHSIEADVAGIFFKQEHQGEFKPTDKIGVIVMENASETYGEQQTLYIPSKYSFKAALQRIIRISNISGGNSEEGTNAQRKGAMETLAKLADAYQVARDACLDDMSNITLMSIRHTFNFSRKVHIAKNAFVILSIISIVLSLLGSGLAIPVAVLIGVSLLWLIGVFIYDTIRLRNSAKVLLEQSEVLLAKEEGVDDFEHKIRILEALAAPNSDVNSGKLKNAADMLLKRSKRSAFTAIITGIFNTFVSKFSGRLDKISSDPKLANTIKASAAIAMSPSSENSALSQNLTI